MRKYDYHNKKYLDPNSDNYILSEELSQGNQKVSDMVYNLWNYVVELEHTVKLKNKVISEQRAELRHINKCLSKRTHRIKKVRKFLNGR